MLVIIGHALAHVVGLEIFNQRYFTILIPLVAALGAAALVALGIRWLTFAATVLLLALGVGNLIKRWGHQFEPSLVPVRAAVTALHPRTVLTDTPVVVYYLGAPASAARPAVQHRPRPGGDVRAPVRDRR